MEETESDEGTQRLNEIFAHALQNNRLDDPILTAKLNDFIKKEREKPLLFQKKGSFSPRVHTKKRDKKEQIRRIKVKGLPSSSTSSEEEIIRIGSVSYGPNQVITHSEPYMPLPVDKADYDIVIEDDAETSDERALSEKLSQLSLKNKEKAREEKKEAALSEIKQFLDQIPDLRQKMQNKAWLDMFAFSNKSDYVNIEDLRLLLCEYETQ